MSTTVVLNNTDGRVLADATKYRRVIGKLQYFCFTRPDITFAVNKFSQFMLTPSYVHWKVVKWVIIYVQVTAHFCL